MLHMIEHVFKEQNLVAAFAVIGAVMWLSLGFRSASLLAESTDPRSPFSWGSL